MILSIHILKFIPICEGQGVYIFKYSQLLRKDYDTQYFKIGQNIVLTLGQIFPYFLIFVYFCFLIKRELFF